MRRPMAKGESARPVPRYLRRRVDCNLVVTIYDGGASLLVWDRPPVRDRSVQRAIEIRSGEPSPGALMLVTRACWLLLLAVALFLPASLPQPGPLGSGTVNISAANPAAIAIVRLPPSLAAGASDPVVGLSWQARRAYRLASAPAPDGAALLPSLDFASPSPRFRALNVAGIGAINGAETRHFDAQAPPQAA